MNFLFWLSLILFFLLVYPWHFYFYLQYKQTLTWKLCLWPLPWGKLKRISFCPLTSNKKELLTNNKIKKIFKKTDVKKIVATYYPAIEIKTWQADLFCGTGDVFSTALLIGGLRALGGGLGAFLFTQLTNILRRPVFRVMPAFEKNTLQAEIRCIFVISLGHIILRKLRTINWQVKRGEESVRAYAK